MVTSKSVVFILILLIFFNETVQLFAQENDYYEMTFEELMNTTVTASRYAQDIIDAPALVTIISDQDIQEMGARTIMDVLVKVPGFNHLQDINEHVLSVRGVYASTNHKFLFLRDGHRLNEPMWEAADYAYSISLASIKKIEIMRGPGSSLYGNSAFTAVINIITKDAEEIDGYYLEGNVGNYGQRSLEGLFGKKWNQSSLLFFAKYATISGELVDLNAKEDYNSKNKISGEMYVDKFPINFDLGFKFINGSFTMLGALHRSHYAQPKGNSGQTINWDQQWHNPEQVFTNSNLALNYERNIGNIDFIGRHYLDHSFLDGWQLLTTRRDASPEGRLFEIATSTLRIGLEYTANYSYNDGNILAGFKVERWELLDSYLLNNWADSSTVVRLKDPLVPAGSEANGAGFFQVQHVLSTLLKFNIGSRYDYYEGFGSSFNPRIALIINPASIVTFKAIYGRSFQSPSYFYRESNPGLGYGSTKELEPEKMDIIQLAARISPSSNCFGEVSYYYNYLRDLISRDNEPDPDVYRNFGEMTARGIEFETKYQSKELSGFANYTYLVPVIDKTEEELVKEKTFKNIPVHTANLGITYKPLTLFSVNVNFNYTSKVYSATPYNPENTLDSKLITDLTVLVKNKPKNFKYSISIHNLFNVEYKLGGTVPPFPQQGRWILGTVGYKF